MHRDSGLSKEDSDTLWNGKWKRHGRNCSRILAPLRSPHSSFSSQISSLLVHIWAIFFLHWRLPWGRNSSTSKTLSVPSFTGNLASNFYLSCFNLKLFLHASYSEEGSTLPQVYPKSFSFNEGDYLWLSASLHISQSKNWGVICYTICGLLLAFRC